MSIFDLPEIKKVYFHLFDTLIDESERGAIIIGASKVEEQLTKYIESILPIKSRTYQRKLLDHPGVLSSFSSKIELAYAFRLINDTLYKSLNKLRKIRNDAAHSSGSFSIDDFKENFKDIFDLGQSVNVFVKNQAVQIMMELKLDYLYKYFDKEKLTKEEIKEQLNLILKDKKIKHTLDKQVPKWELIFGLTMICGMIKHFENEVNELLGNSDTWLKLKNKSEEKSAPNSGE